MFCLFLFSGVGKTSIARSIARALNRQVKSFLSSHVLVCLTVFSCDKSLTVLIQGSTLTASVGFHFPDYVIIVIIIVTCL